MSRLRPDQPLVPSVLDRLVDRDPTVSTEPHKSRFQLVRELKQAVRRDLENLLNTRVRCQSFPPELTELETSLASYGIPDFSGVPFGTADDRRRFAATIESIVSRFEPRFKTVSVEMLDEGERVDRKLHFRIDALLHCEPAPEPVTFDSSVEPTTGVFEVRGSKR